MHSSRISWEQVTTRVYTQQKQRSLQCTGSIRDSADHYRLAIIIVFQLVSHVFRHKICLQGHSSATYSVWLIGNDNCYILHFQQRGNFLVLLCFTKYLLHQQGPLRFTSAAAQTTSTCCCNEFTLHTAPNGSQWKSWEEILTFTVIAINSEKQSISQICKM